MAKFKIKEIYRDTINTKFGERENIKIVPYEDEVNDVDGDPIVLDGRRITGFRDKEGETDKWVKDMVIKVPVKVNKSQGKEGDMMEWVNFHVPKETDTVVEAPSGAVEATDPEDDF
jgi:hypothetical protein